MSDADLRTRATDANLTERDRDLAIGELLERERKKAVNAGDTGKANEIAELQRRRRTGEINQGDATRIEAIAWLPTGTIKTGPNPATTTAAQADDPIPAPPPTPGGPLPESGDALYKKVDGFSDEVLRARLKDPNLTWDQRRAIMAELNERAKEDASNLGSYASDGRKARLTKLYELYSEGKLTQKDAEEYAGYLGISVDQLYKRPPGYQSNNGYV
jgi:hypothetical protein